MGVVVVVVKGDGGGESSTSSSNGSVHWPAEVYVTQQESALTAPAALPGLLPSQ